MNVRILKCTEATNPEETVDNEKTKMQENVKQSIDTNPEVILPEHEGEKELHDKGIENDYVSVLYDNQNKDSDTLVVDGEKVIS